MQKQVGLIGFLMLLFIVTARGQCVYTCSNYIVSPITYSLHPTAGTTVSLMDDDITTTVPLGFNFDFYCNTYNQVRIASNGFITFDFGPINLPSTPYAQPMPSNTTPNGVIAWNWNDLDPSTATGGGSISYTTVGVAPDQKFIVTYSAVPLWTISAPPASQLLNTGQIILYESTNIIEIHIGKALNNGWLTHTEGIENATGTSGIAVTSPYRNLSLWTATNSAHMFSPYAITNTLSVAGSPTVCNGAAVTFSANSNPPPSGYYWQFPPAWTGSGSNSTVSATAGNGSVISVSASYSCGNSVAATLAVNVLPAPQISITAVSPTVVCAGLPVTFTPAGASSYTLSPGTTTAATQ